MMPRNDPVSGRSGDFYSLNRAEIFSGVKFHLKVEFPSAARADGDGKVNLTHYGVGRVGGDAHLIAAPDEVGADPGVEP